MRKTLPIFLFLFMSSMLWAQYSPKTQWQKLNTEHFNIIFDEKIGDDAQKIANDLENYYVSLVHDMGWSMDRYTIILPAQMIESNGYVSSINNKSVFYPVPPTKSFNGTIEWYKALTIHEGRHMAQFSHVRDSFIQKMLGFLFGSYGINGAVFIPGYFYEGDAVLTETLYSNSGRGRSPAFERGLRTIILSDKDYSFSKALLLSGKDYNPNHYVLGYYLMTYLKNEYGSDVLPNIVNKAGNNIFPLNFSSASFFTTGKTMPMLYKDLKDDLYEKWSDQDSMVKPTDIKTIVQNNSNKYINKTNPVVTSLGDLLYLEGFLYEKPYLVQIKDGKEIKHKAVSSNFSYFKNKIIYSSESADPRWLYKGYSDIYSYNIDNKKTEKITNLSRYFDPKFSNNGEQIAVIEFSEFREASIVIIDSKTGDIKNTYKFNKGDMINALVWTKDDKKLVVIKQSDVGNSIGVLDIESEKYETITNEDSIERSCPTIYDNSVLFISSYSGIENINSINLDSKEEYQVVSSRFGVNYPWVNNDDLYFSTYSINGYNIGQIKLNPKDWIPLSNVSRNHVDYFEPLINDIVQTKDDFKEYEAFDYNPSTHLIKIHSWLINPILPAISSSPVFDIDIDLAFDVQELVLFSSDYLEKMDSVFYSHYNMNRELFDVGTYGVYRGFYPEIGWDINLYSNDITSEVTSLDGTLKFEIPLLYLGNTNNQQISLGLSPSLYKNFSDNSLSQGDLLYYISYGINVFDYNFSTVLSLDHGINYDNGINLGLGTNISTPGLLKKQTLELSTSSFWELTNLFENTQNEFKIDYLIPLFYPDLSILNWIYVSSFDLDIGYNYTYYAQDDNINQISSAISITYYLLRMPVPFYSEFKYFYDIENEKFDYFITPITFKYAL